MVIQIRVTKEIAHLLTKVSKKEKWYFRCLTRTDRSSDVDAEIHESGVKYMDDNNIYYTKITQK